MPLATVKIIIAPDSFKESLAAPAAAQAIATGMRRVLPNAGYDLVPMADGGEGTVAAVVAARGGTIVETRVTAPRGEIITAAYGVLSDDRMAVIEMAAASGLALVPAARRDPTRTTSFGTGELMLAALDGGCGAIVIGLGGSATCDGGIGMLQALGVRFYDEAGRLLDAPLGGGALLEVGRMDLSGLDPRLREVTITAACDVDNALTGPNGAAHTFGPQKGADARQVEDLDRGLAKFYQRVEGAQGIKISATPGAGAAGGLGAALVGILGARLRPGIEVVAEAVRLAERIRGSTVVITGEGRIDAQSLRGKTPLGVARISAAEGVPVVAIGGSLAPDARAVFDVAIDALETAVTRPMSTGEALGNSRAHLEDAAERVARWLILAPRLVER